MKCHIAVTFPGWSPLDFAAERDAAVAFAIALSHRVHITIDEEVRESMPLLPCERLWRQV